MTSLTRRSVLQRTVGLAAAGALARPFIANAAATTAEVWWTQGFVPEEDTAFKKLVEDYEKTSGNKINYSITPYAALRQKEISAITSGVVPDMMEIADFAITPINAWEDKLVPVDDIVEPIKAQFLDFGSAIRNRHKPLVAGEEGYAALEIILGIYESAKRGEKVTIGS